MFFSLLSNRVPAWLPYLAVGLSAASGILLWVATSAGDVRELQRNLALDSVLAPFGSTGLMGSTELSPGISLVEHVVHALTLLLVILCILSIFVARSASEHRLLAERSLENLVLASEERRKAERSVDSFFNVSITPMCVIGFDGFAKRLNAPWASLLGYSEIQLMSQPLIDFVHPDDRAATVGMLADLEHGANVFGFENRLLTSTGDSRWFNWNATTVPVEQIIVANAKDITESKEREFLNETKTAKLMRSNSDLERFAFMASHDMQEPLRMVASFAQQLSKHYKGQLDPRADRYINYVVDGALRMQGMISALLSYSRLEQSNPVMVSIETEDVMRVALRNLQTAILESEAQVSFDPLPVLHADPSLLAHLFQNLIANALKFRRDLPPRIHVSAQASEQEWIFLVEDQGIGIRAEDSERVFDLFQRLHSKSEYPGSGMGLSICQKIVQRHNGRIWVDSIVGQGSKFYFSIPGNQVVSSHA